MNRILYLFLTLLIVLSLNACCAEKETLKPESFTDKVKICSADGEYEGIFVFENENSMYFEFTEPSEIAGIKVLYSNGNYNITFDSVTADMGLYADNSPVFELFGTVHALAVSDAEISQDGECGVAVKSQGSEYTCKIDCDEKRIVGIYGAETEIMFEYCS